MTLLRALVKDAAIGVGVTDSPEGLSTIHRPGCAAVVWRRAPAPDFQAWMDGLKPQALPTARVIVQPDRVRDVIAALMPSDGMGDTQANVFADDVAALATLFAQVMDCPYVRLRLDAVTTNACRKFHIDAVTARLICTYRGTGTQYGISTDGMDPQRVFTVPTSAPIVLRGTHWPDPPASGLLHRSPPIEGTGETRLLLVLDPVADLEEETAAQKRMLH